MSSTRAADARRVAVFLVLLTSLMFLGSRERETAVAAQPSPIADAALRQLGTHGGQCWTFMQRAVAEATGRRVGTDYRQGFFEAGAIEVSAEEATTGDIIQIASDANTSPWASYPGLHTAIVLENLGGGRFDAIDSNQNWDEMVRLRPDYDPYAAAARYGLQVHIYRIPGGSDMATPGSAGTQPWSAGDQAVVATGSDCLNLRTGPSLFASRRTCLQGSTPVTALGEGSAGDGFVWVEVDTSSGRGWVAATYLARVETPTPDPDPAAAAAAVGDEAPPGDQAPPPATASVDNSPGCLRLRAAAGLGASIRACLAAGTQVTVLSESTVGSDGYQWLNVRTSAGGEGWVASEYLIR